MFGMNKKNKLSGDQWKKKSISQMEDNYFKRMRRRYNFKTMGFSDWMSFLGQVLIILFIVLYIFDVIPSWIARGVASTYMSKQHATQEYYLDDIRTENYFEITNSFVLTYRIKGGAKVEPAKDAKVLVESNKNSDSVNVVPKDLDLKNLPFQGYYNFYDDERIELVIGPKVFPIYVYQDSSNQPKKPLIPSWYVDRIVEQKSSEQFASAETTNP